VKRAIRTHLTDFGAILVLLALSVVVAGYVLSHERFQFPLIESSPFTLNAEFSAQAVTPGQGQSVRVSGVQIGLIGNVTLKNGIADVQLQINDEYKNLIHTDATALLRPKTGLKDMFIEVDPGAKPAPVAKPGWTMPVSNTLPDVDVDEILSSLDGDTRNYLNLLVNGAGQGLRGKGGDELAQVLERFEPTHQDLARLNRAVAVRGTDLRQLVNSLQRLNTALATKQVADRAARRLERHRVPGVRLSGHQHQSRRRRPPRDAAADGGDAQQGADVRQAPGPDSVQPAAGGPLATRRQRRDHRAGEAERPDRPEPDPAVRDRRPAARAPAQARRDQPGGGDAQHLQDLRCRQPIRQHARLQPGGHRARVPLVAGVA
jgi:hypothetical protein